MSNQTQNWTWSTTVAYAASLLPAEWIQEAPSSNAGVRPLANFGTEGFTPTVNLNLTPNFPAGPNGTVGPDAIQMIDPYGETSNPSVPDTAGPKIGEFNVCWGNNPTNIATCNAP